MSQAKWESNAKEAYNIAPPRDTGPVRSVQHATRFRRSSKLPEISPHSAEQSISIHPGSLTFQFSARMSICCLADSTLLPRSQLFVRGISTRKRFSMRASCDALI